jgi:hypothetical protein
MADHVTDPGKAVFLSYASQDAEAAQQRINADVAEMTRDPRSPRSQSSHP